MINLLLLSFLQLVISPVGSQQFRCQGKSNPYDIYTDKPTFIRSVPNGKLFQTGDPENNSSWFIVHLSGSDYDQGFASGQLTGKEIISFSEYMFNYLHNTIDYFIDILPPSITLLIEEFGLDFALDFVYELIREETPQHHFEFLRGVSDGCGLEYINLRRLAMVGEMLKSDCTLFGATGSSRSDFQNTLIQFRGLDQRAHFGPYKDLVIPMMLYPTITVHHFTDPGSNKVVNIGPIVSSGTLQGFNDKFISLANKYFETSESLMKQNPGYAYMYHLLDSLRYSDTIFDVIDVYNAKNIHRTCSFYVGVGHAENNHYTGVKYRVENVTTYNYKNQSIYPQHPEFTDVVYWDKYQYPSPSYCLSDLLEHYYDDYSVKNLLDIFGYAKTGDTTAIVFDYWNAKMYVAWGLGKEYAYNKQFVMIDMKEIFEM